MKEKAKKINVDAIQRHLFRVPNRHVYGILDGALIDGLLDALDEHEPEFTCLYHGDLEPDLVECAPYLVRYDRDSAFLRWVLQEGWDNHWGVMISSEMDMRTLRKHFRTFLMVYNPEGELMYFRYYDPRVLSVYLPTCNAHELRTIFGPVIEYLFEGEKPGTLRRYSIENKLLQLESFDFTEAYGRHAQKSAKLFSRRVNESAVFMENREYTSSEGALPTEEGADAKIPQLPGKVTQLPIRAEQLAVFNASALEVFILRMLSTLRSEYEENTVEMSDESLRQLVEEGIIKARTYGIEMEEDVEVYLGYILVYGRDFVEQDVLHGAKNILVNTDIDSTEKMEQLELLDMMNALGEE